MVLRDGGAQACGKDPSFQACCFGVGLCIFFAVGFSMRRRLARSATLRFSRYPSVSLYFAVARCCAALVLTGHPQRVEQSWIGSRACVSKYGRMGPCRIAQVSKGQPSTVKVMLRLRVRNTAHVKRCWAYRLSPRLNSTVRTGFLRYSAVVQVPGQNSRRNSQDRIPAFAARLWRA
jgi:hypothetical protein